MRSVSQSWRIGDRVAARGEIWRIDERTVFPDCEGLRLSATAGQDAQIARTLLLPFDRPRRLERSSSIAVIRPRRWLHVLRRAAARAHPIGGLKMAARSDLDLLAYQLEPALAMIGMGVSRVLIADSVGLGKTIQAGLVLSELAGDRSSCRALVVAPAGLREQWSEELATRFHLETTIAAAQWLGRAGHELPPEVNPWTLPGIYVSSFDFIKRPEVLRPLEEVEWDIVVVDEAHGAAAGTARHAAVHAVALRAQRVLLLSATPHGGDLARFDALCRLGARPAEDGLMMFQRSRADAGAESRRRTVLFPVRLSGLEERMHRLLDDYAGRVCREAGARGDPRARLAIIVLKKRALSSAASLAASARKRLILLAGAGPDPAEFQLPLPLDDDVAEDAEPDAILAAPGLADGAHERRLLSAVIDAAQSAAAAESKTAFLLRLLRRMREPAIVFTEYRDTLERLAAVAAAAGHGVRLLHGALSASDRSRVQREFNNGGGILLATDAASEGLNLHTCCRVVIHYELPWSPARLEQRTGRVDRIGQRRAVHDILLVAGSTAERLVIAPLARRAARARVAAPSSGRLWTLLNESRVAAAIMEGKPIQDEDVAAPFGAAPFVHAPAWLRQSAELECRRLHLARRSGAAHGFRAAPAGVAAAVLPLRKSALPAGVLCVYLVSLSTAAGDRVHEELVTVHDSFSADRSIRSAAVARCVVREFIDVREPAVRGAVLAAKSPELRSAARRHGRSVERIKSRAQAMAIALPSAAATLVQDGLFDRRAVRAGAASRRASATLLEASEQRLASLAEARQLTPGAELVAVLIASPKE